MKTDIVFQSISGGMDSTCLALYHLAQGKALHLLSFDYGQKHRLELERLDANLAYFNEKGLAMEHNRIVVPFGQIAASALTTGGQDPPEGFYAEASMKQTVVPNRNAIFASILYAAALSTAVAKQSRVSISMGVHAGDHEIYPDCRAEFFQCLLASFSIGNWDSELIVPDFPYLEWDKEAILRRALMDCATLGLDFDTVLANTNTSYAPNEAGEASGRTGSDVERILAFHAIGRQDPVAYAGGWEAALAYALQAQESFAAK